MAGLWRDTGGPAEVIPNLCVAQVQAGLSVVLVSIDGDNAIQLQALKETSVEVKLVKAVDGTIRYAPQLKTAIERLGEIDLIHNHGHWLFPNWYAARHARDKNCPLVTTPHGTLVPGMLERSAFKKRIAWQLFDRNIVVTAKIIHALSSAEKTGMSPKLGPFASKVSVIPNGVHLRPQARLGVRKEETRTLLFLSRLAPIKGVLQLLEAWQKINTAVPDWKLKLVGPIEPVIQIELNKMNTRSLRIDVHGPSYGDERWEEYSNADAFVLPTKGEGLPTVLLEAAAHGLPILTTKEANFAQLIELAGCRVTRPEVEFLAEDIQRFLNAPLNERIALGERARSLVGDIYSWSSVGNDWAVTYKALLDEQHSGK